MKRLQFLMGFLCGALMLGGFTSVASASSGIMAAISNQAVYVDGRQVSLTAYQIGGNNYVKLRDIGEAVGFNVYWDGIAVQVESDKPYTGEAPVTQTPAPAPAPSYTPAPALSTTGSYTISTDHWSREDYSQRANPSVFTATYDRALYNTIRQTLVDGGPGSTPAYTMVSKADYSAVKKLLGRMDSTRWLEHYVPKDFTNYWQYLDYFAVDAKTPEQYQSALNYIQPVIAQANQFSTDQEKVEYLHDYLCSLLSYDVKAIAVIPQIFTAHSGELKGACGAYGSAFSFLCNFV